MNMILAFVTGSLEKSLKPTASIVPLFFYSHQFFLVDGCFASFSAPLLSKRFYIILCEFGKVASFHMQYFKNQERINSFSINFHIKFDCNVMNTNTLGDKKKMKKKLWSRLLVNFIRLFTKHLSLIPSFFLVYFRRNFIQAN